MASSTPAASAQDPHQYLAPTLARISPKEIFFCTEQDLEDIARIISTLAQESLLSLLPRERELMVIGDRIRHVHPLKFISVILSDPRLKKGLQQIHEDKTVASWHGWNFSLPWVFDSFSKWSYFIKELSEKLKTKHREENSILPYLEGFIQEANLDLSGAARERITSYVDAQDWNGFILFLLSCPNRN